MKSLSEQFSWMDFLCEENCFQVLLVMASATFAVYFYVYKHSDDGSFVLLDVKVYVRVGKLFEKTELSTNSGKVIDKIH